jgi:hypothetical protein
MEKDQRHKVSAAIQMTSKNYKQNVPSRPYLLFSAITIL